MSILIPPRNFSGASVAGQEVRLTPQADGTVKVEDPAHVSHLLSHGFKHPSDDYVAPKSAPAPEVPKPVEAAPAAAETPATHDPAPEVPTPAPTPEVPTPAKNGAKKK